MGRPPEGLKEYKNKGNLFGVNLLLPGNEMLKAPHNQRGNIPPSLVGEIHFGRPYSRAKIELKRVGRQNVPFLQLYSGKNQVAEEKLEPGKVIHIGRYNGDTHVSHTHAAIMLSKATNGEDLLLIEDQGSLNGTTVIPTTQLNRKGYEALPGTQVLEKTDFHASPFNGEMLSTDFLMKEGLEPVHSTVIDGREIWFSQIYESLNNRIAVVGYVADGKGRFIARTYYRSNSAGIWRYLPDYHTTEDGQTINLYGKGRGENSITLPVVMQKILSDISTKETPKKLSSLQAIKLALVGTARVAGGDYTLLGEIDELPKKLTAFPYFPTADRKVRPELLNLVQKDYPKLYQNPQDTWKQYTSLSGQITLETFPSNDGKLLYIFWRDAQGHVGITGAESRERQNKIGSTGLYPQWVDLGDLATPLYEYANFTDGYEDQGIVNGQYRGMWGYLSRIPVIQDYMNSLRNRK